jgi:hypothetical protein
MAKHAREWRPSPEEVRRIVAEMRPILRDFERRASDDRRTRVAS